MPSYSYALDGARKNEAAASFCRRERGQDGRTTGPGNTFYETVLVDTSQERCCGLGAPCSYDHASISFSLPVERPLLLLPPLQSALDITAQVFSGVLLRTFQVAAPTDGDPARQDTSIAMPNSVKGVVWANGFSVRGVNLINWPPTMVVRARDTSEVLTRSQVSC